jgi:NAD(P)-dependent dehydrogenase (short-subunit alcohol dehydrogenase family)
MKKIFLTGASSGIGKAIAEALLARGHEVWGTSRDIPRLAAMRGLHPVQLDLADRASIGAAFAGALHEAGKFDVVINNAGSGHFGPAELLNPAYIDQLFQTLVFAHLELCRIALAAMDAQESGMIINVTSLAAELPVPYMAAYNAAKAAMASFTMTMQLELGGRNIQLIDVQPGDICTDFNDAVQRTGEDDPRFAERVRRAWTIVDRNMKNAPKPMLVGRRIADLIDESNPPPRVIVGDFFQSKIAPLIVRLLPQRARLWSLKQYYRI